MDPPSQGRSRGRARGRTFPSEQHASSTPVPGAAPEQLPLVSTHGPGRGRGRGPIFPQAGPSTSAPQEVKYQPKMVFTTKCIENKKGTSGTPLDLYSNFFEVSKLPNYSFYQYCATFEPEVDRLGERRALLRMHSDTLKGFLFDGTSLFTNIQYQSDPLVLFAQNSNKENVQILLKRTAQLDNTSSNYNQLLNIIANKCLQLMGLTRLGRNYYDPQARVLIHEFGLELWPGYITSIRQHESEVLMCSAITYKVLRRDTVFQAMENAFRQHGPNYMQPLKQTILGVVVMTHYNNRTYRIDDIDFDANPMTQFSLKDGSKSTFVEYYKKRYNITITNLQQPLLVTKVRGTAPGTTETIYLVPELCRLTGLTDEMRGNYQLMASLAKFTRVEPQKRIDSLLNFGRRLMEKREIGNELSKWNMSFSPQLIRMQGRELPMETIIQGDASNPRRYEAGRNVDWTAKLRSNPLLVGVKMERWIAIVPRPIQQESMSFISLILQAARGMFMGMSEPLVHYINDDSVSTYLNEIENVLSRAVPDILLCMVSTNRADRYAAIKKKCCIDRAVPTQVVTKRSMSNRSAMSIATKISIQMNCKVGGAPWSCHNPLKGVMVCGFDATHDSINKSRSYGAFVASLNDEFSKYFSMPFAHSKGCDISNNMGTAFETALAKFRKYNDGCLPSRIFMYRDGVGDGQIDYVLNIEVEQIKATLEKHYRGTNYKFAFVIVSKRINTKFFTSGKQNPPPGTVVDDRVTWPERYDFFLVSQSVRQGTVSPTSYNVIFDTTGLDPDKMQRFTYKLTHLYYNWSGTIKVPAPVQYAHKLSELIGQHLHNEPQRDLDERLYYL
ncbi:piwi-like protein Siwi [Cloeon dipterum]|uniref:piwi-like protein Siwi n=1 Tax=Cloeon dipterum TaxID=197152 RepID=UPI00321FBE45